METLISLAIILLPRLIEMGVVRADETMMSALSRLAAARQDNAAGDAEWQQRLAAILAGQSPPPTGPKNE